MELRESFLTISRDRQSPTGATAAGGSPAGPSAHAQPYEMFSQRELRGSWLAYWGQEVGLSENVLDPFVPKLISLLEFQGHSKAVRSLCVLPSENSFASASKDHTVKLWSIRNHGSFS